MPAASCVRPLSVSSRRDSENDNTVSPIRACSVISVKLDSTLGSSAMHGRKNQRISEVCTGGEASKMEKPIVMLCVSRPSSVRLSASTTGGTVYTKGGYSIETNTQEDTALRMMC